MYLMVDNYDSFVYNLAAYMVENGQDVLVRRADLISFSEIKNLDLEGIIISPGPKRPQDAVVSIKILKMYQGIVPILGVCLGHQIIGQFYGANICRGISPCHGKITQIEHNSRGIFTGLPVKYSVTRYHSLIVSEKGFPNSLNVTARSENDGVIMGLEHTKLPVYGVQFHPEAVLTKYGHELLLNFHNICKQWTEFKNKEAYNALYKET